MLRHFQIFKFTHFQILKMQDLLQQLKANAGLTDVQAIKAMETMKEYIHSKVPPMFSGFVDKFFEKNNTIEEIDPLSP